MKNRCLTKILCLALVFVLSASLLPMTANAAYTAAQLETLNKVLSVVTKQSRERTVELTINDMKFTGRLYNTALTDTNVMDFVEEVMKMDDLKLTFDGIDKKYKQVDKMIEVMGFSEADMKRIRDNVITIVGAVLSGWGGVPDKIGDVITVLQGVYQLITKEPEEAAKGSGWALVGKGGDYVSDTSMGGKGVAWGQAAMVMADEWVRSQAKYGQMRDGLEAGRILQRLYSRVDTKIRNFCYENMDKNVIHFDEAVAKKKTFTLFGAQCTETWTLDMELKYKSKADTNPNHQGGYLDGNYEGSYFIWIEYDLGNLAAILPDLVQTREWKETRNAATVHLGIYEDTIFQSLSYTLTDPGAWIVSRKLSGNATARYLNDNATITPAQTEDKKVDDVKNPVIRASGLYTQTFPDIPAKQGYYDLKIVANGDALYVYVGNRDGDGKFQENVPWTIPWGDNFWKRGDNVKQSWTLKIFPRK